MRIAILVAVILGLWFLFGRPSVDAANWFWPNSAAPWERVDAAYYPDRDNLSNAIEKHDLTDVDECRGWAYWQAGQHGDPSMQRGDYECGIGFLESWAGMQIYRVTIR